MEAGPAEGRKIPALISRSKLDEEFDTAVAFLQLKAGKKNLEECWAGVNTNEAQRQHLVCYVPIL